ncbi:MAG: helix-turn-helix domain-containing protein [Deltaproteobacteria bacterium]|nr:helix-turn-helix domain-containing protein [Deltaproteobacteria bacterium]
MRAEISIPPELVSAIVNDVVARLKPILTGLQMKLSPVDDLMGVAELGKYLGGVSRDWIYQRTAGNEIPFVKVGRMIKFRRSDIDRWLSARSVPTVAPLSAPLPGGKPRDCESRGTGKTHCVIAKV